MFSGGDSSDSINSLNPLGTYGFVNQVAVSNAMAAGQNIDWAQLAQQWIQMRDNSESEAKMAPNTSTSKVADSGCTNFKFEEKGEADMDMDDEEQTDDKTTHRITNDFVSTSVVNNLNQSWCFAENNSELTRRSTSDNQWNLWPNRENLIPDLPNTNAVNSRPINPTAHIPSLLKITVPHPNEIRIMPDIPHQADNSNMMDAAKRKGLPAWIREGLEKMEREKQKQLEKEQQSKDVNNEDKTSIKNNLVSLNSLNDAPTTILDEESSGNEETITISPNSQRDINLKMDNEKEDNEHNSIADKTYEQKIADLMIAVRRTLTELLLEATNEEISKVADETIKIFKSKASSAQVIRKSALSTLTGKLGLAAYGDSSSENDSDNDDCNSAKKTTGQSESENDSEEEIWNVIRLKRRTFLKTSEEIEERVASAAAREEEKLKYFLQKEQEEEKEYSGRKLDRPLIRDPSSSGHSGHNIFKGYDKDFGEITETKIQHPNGKRQKERSSRRERITRFSDNKDKYVSLPNATSFLTNITSGTNFCGGNTTTALSTNSQRQNIPDINGLLPNYKSSGMSNVLNAADAALEKALKGKTSTSPEKQTRGHERNHSYKQSKKRQRLSESKNSRSRSRSSSSSTSSSSSSTSSDSDSSFTSQSSHHSKYKHRSEKKHKLHTAERHEKSHKGHRGERKYSSYSYEKRDRQSTSSRNHHRNASSDSEDEYRRRHRNNSYYSSRSSKTRSYTSSRRSRDREHSRSQSRSSYSSSSNRRQ